MKPFLELLGVSHDNISPFSKTQFPPDLKSALLNYFKKYMGKSKIIQVVADEEDGIGDGNEEESQNRANDPGQLNKEQEEIMLNLTDNVLSCKEDNNSSDQMEADREDPMAMSSQMRCRIWHHILKKKKMGGINRKL
jgi:hypothetical protein